VKFNVHQNAVRTHASDYYQEPCDDCNVVPLLHTTAWSNNPHIARKSFFTSHCMKYLDLNSNVSRAGFIELPLMMQIHSDLVHSKEARSTLKSWGTYVYGHEQAGPVVRHLNGRMRDYVRNGEPCEGRRGNITKCSFCERTARCNAAGIPLHQRTYCKV